MQDVTPDFDASNSLNFYATLGYREVDCNNRINSDWQFRCAPLPAGYAERKKQSG